MDNIFKNLKKVDDILVNENGYQPYCIDQIFGINDISVDKSIACDNEMVCNEYNNSKISLDSIDDDMMNMIVKYNLKYLYGCYERYVNLNLKLKDTKIYNENIMKKIYEFILRYSCTCIEGPEIFNISNISEQLCILIENGQNDKLFYDYLLDIRNKFTLEDNFKIYTEILSYILFTVMNNVYLITDPAYYKLVIYLKYFTSDEYILRIFIKSFYFLTSIHLTEVNYDLFLTHTYFGLLFGAMCTNGNRNEYSYYNFETMNKMDIKAIRTSLSTTLCNIYDQMVFCIKRILAQKILNHSIYIWYYSFISASFFRTKLSSDIESNFMFSLNNAAYINVTYVALQIFYPFIQDINKFLTRFQSNYCQYYHQFNDGYREYSLNFRNESFFGELPNFESTPNIDFNFPTHWFYLTHSIIRVGVIPTFAWHAQLLKETNRLKGLLNETEVVSATHYLYERLENEILCIETHIYCPIFTNMLIDFMSMTCVYFLHLCDVNITDINNSYIIKTNPDKFKYIPTYIIEQITEYFDLYVNPYVRKCYDPEVIYCVVLCFVALMGNRECLSNPHIRANLARTIYIRAVLQYAISSHSPSIDRFNFAQYPMLVKNLPCNLIKLFIDIEFTGNTNEFLEKFVYRYYMYKILFHVWEIYDYLMEFKNMAKDALDCVQTELHFFLKFINLLINDSTYLLDEALSSLKKIHQLEMEISSPEFNELEDEAKEEKKSLLKSTIKLAGSYNEMSINTIDALYLLTRDIVDVFYSTVIIDRIASMLNYFLKILVGSNKSELKVRNMEKVKFEPRRLMTRICEIYVNLTGNKSFHLSIISDIRSFDIEMFKNALDILKNINASYTTQNSFVKLIEELSRIKIMDNIQDIDADEIPDEFLDPISYTLMLDPVMLPTSQVIVDRTTITKHLLSDEKDPFNRSRLTIDMVINQDELKEKIKEWIKNRKL